MKNTSSTIMTAVKSDYGRFFPPTFTLETPRVLLRLLAPEDLKPLSALAKDKSIWQWFVQDLSEEQAMKEWMDGLLLERQQEKRMPFTVIDKDGYTICGSTSYLNISFFDKRLEIGSTWLGTEFIGTGVNRHAKFALLCYAFEVMKMERVEVKTDNLNERAKAALLKCGFIPEGVLRSHMQVHSDRRRDSIYFSLLRDEWPERKESFFVDLL
jgi:RimJ/RimL family protein N-acetyltransferase